jgi:hypothetical protein
MMKACARSFVLPAENRLLEYECCREYTRRSPLLKRYFEPHFGISAWSAKRVVLYFCRVRAPSFVVTPLGVARQLTSTPNEI